MTLIFVEKVITTDRVTSQKYFFLNYEQQLKTNQRWWKNALEWSLVMMFLVRFFQVGFHLFIQTLIADRTTLTEKQNRAQL